MLKRYSFWLKLAAIFQLLTGAVHSIGLFIDAQPANDSERQLQELMNNYKMDAGAGFHPSMQNLFTALSACFSLVCFLGGWLNFYLVRKKIDPSILKGVTGINLIVFGVCFAIMLTFTFLPPIALTGLISLFLLISYALTPRLSAKVAVNN